MDIPLKEFQEERIADLLLQCDFARKESGAGKLQAVVLSAPTGSGKTIMAIGVMEGILAGSSTLSADANATFLWVTDQPDLNEQSRRKVVEYSDILGQERVVTIDASFDQEVLEEGKLYFLNIQKLSKNSSLVSEADKRNFTIWQTITNSVERAPQSFWLILDEAHKGMAKSSSDIDEANSIVQKFIKGSGGETPPVPLILGVSATPDRFRSLLSDVGRLQRDVTVTPKEVVDSGLLKETVLVYHPSESTAADITLLKEAASAVKRFEEEWAQYHEQNGEATVRPVLVVQVEEKSAHSVTKTDMEEALSAIEEVLGPMDPSEFAHCFYEEETLEVGSLAIRYVSPPDIQNDPKLRVVLFKMALNTGWDCPRAEVMMSFRKAKDHTYIAQLVGRMVRTPLAHRIESNEVLNTVSLYLPHYDEEGLKKVLEHLQSPDLETMPPVGVELGTDAILLERNQELDDCFSALEQVPTYVVSTVRQSSSLKRLMKFARHLANDEVLFDAINIARDAVVDHLQQCRKELEGSDRFEKILKASGSLDLREVEITWGVGATESGDSEVELTQENVDDLFKAAARRAGEGLETIYRKARAQEDKSSAKRQAKLEFIALMSDQDVVTGLDDLADKQIQEWTDKYKSEIDQLSPDRREPYHQVWRTSKAPVEITMSTLPETIRGKRIGNNWEQHLFVDDEGHYPQKFNSWEQKTLEEEQGRSDFIGFLRNEDRKKWSLCIPWQAADGTHKPVYPDFITFRKHGAAVRVGVLDPHNPNLDDSWRKAVGMANYAAKHHHLFDCFDVIVVDGDTIKRFDLTNQTDRAKVAAVTSNDQLKALLFK